MHNTYLFITPDNNRQCFFSSSSSSAILVSVLTLETHTKLLGAPKHGHSSVLPPPFPAPSLVASEYSDPPALPPSLRPLPVYVLVSVKLPAHFLCQYPVETLVDPRVVQAELLDHVPGQHKELDVFGGHDLRRRLLLGGEAHLAEEVVLRDLTHDGPVRLDLAATAEEVVEGLGARG